MPLTIFKDTGCSALDISEKDWCESAHWKKNEAENLNLLRRRRKKVSDGSI